MLKFFLKSVFGLGIILYLLTILNVIHFYFTNSGYLYQTDLMASFLTGARVIREGMAESLYDFETQLKFQNIITFPFKRDLLLPFRNTPLVGAIYIPLTYMNLRTATIVVLFSNIFLLIAFYKYFSEYLGGSRMQILPATMFFWPIIAVYITGQNTIFTLTVFAWMYILIREEKFTLAGIISSLILLRPQNILFLPFLLPLVKEKMKYLKVFTSMAILLLIINVAIVGIPEMLKYPGFVMITEVSKYGNRIDEIVSVYFLLKQIFPQLSSYALTSINALLYMLIFVLYFKSRQKRTFESNIMIGILTTVVFSIHSLSQDLIILLIPIYFLYSQLCKPSVYNRILLALLYFSPIIVLFTNASLVTVILLLTIGFIFFFYTK